MINTVHKIHVHICTEPNKSKHRKIQNGYKDYFSAESGSGLALAQQSVSINQC